MCVHMETTEGYRTNGTYKWASRTYQEQSQGRIQQSNWCVSKFVHKDETFWFSAASCRYSDSCNNIDHLFLVIWLATCFQIPLDNSWSLPFPPPQSQQKGLGTIAGTLLTQPPQWLDQAPQKEKWHFAAYKFDNLRWMTWLLHGGFVCLFS